MKGYSPTFFTWNLTFGSLSKEHGNQDGPPGPFLKNDQPWETRKVNMRPLRSFFFFFFFLHFFFASIHGAHQPLRGGEIDRRVEEDPKGREGESLLDHRDLSGNLLLVAIPVI